MRRPGGRSFPVDSVEATARFTSDPSSLSRIATITPDPSSISDYPAATPSESSSTSSNSSLNGRQGLLVLERLEENLSRVSRSPMWCAAVDDPPRKLVLSSPVLQVVNQNTVKDRFLFLFTDILVIAKPVASDHHDSLADPFKLSLPDKKYSVKSVAQLQKLRFCADRMEASKSPILGPRNSLVRSFISEFSVDPDRAIASLFTKAKVDPDPALLGQLLFKAIEVDRSRLGDYLTRRTSRAVLKSYLDGFNFVGLRVDVALRVFLHSINISQYAHTYGTLEYLLDFFASRWYEANTKFVAFDKDMAVQLVWALAQLNDRLHGSIADEPGATDKILRTVTTREFQDAFRRYDTRYLVSDDLLQELYRSIFHERLCQACPSILNSQEVPITIKRPYQVE
jgi:serine/arginine repetitive matrix protein 2